jgi:PII-like signaling protein
MVFTSEGSLYDGVPVHRALIRRLRESQRATGATALRGMWGFHGTEPPHGDRLLQLSRRVPVTTIVVDTPDGIARSFEIVDEVTRQYGLVTSEMVPALVSIGERGSRHSVELASYDY